jgi:hypothetical protein
MAGRKSTSHQSPTKFLIKSLIAPTFSGRGEKPPFDALRIVFRDPCDYETGIFRPSFDTPHR